MKRSLVFLLLFVGWTCHATAGTVTYSALINTASVAGTTGSLDFNFQTGPFGALPATVQVERFLGGLPSDLPERSGNVSGALPGTLALGNDGDYNDYFQTFAFGSLLSFDIVLSGPAVGMAAPGTSGSTSSFSVFSDTGGTQPALSSNPDGFALTADINADGTTTLRNYTAPVTPVSATPENPTALLVLTGMVFALAVHWRRCL